MRSGKISLLILFTALFSFFEGNAGGDLIHYNDPLKKSFITNSKQLPDLVYQKLLMQHPFWLNFIEENGKWQVMFNESSGMPHRAYGKPVSVPGYDAKSTALNFINGQLAELGIPVNDLIFSSVNTNSKYHYVNFIQYYQGLEVIQSKVQIKLTHDFLVNQFALDCFPQIQLNINPDIGPAQALQYAKKDVPGFQNGEVNSDLKILPIPAGRIYSFHLVYEIMVINKDEAGIPGRYYTLVDASTGEILFRTNMVRHINDGAGNGSVNVTGSLYVTHPYNPSTTEPLRNLKVDENGVISYTDDFGFLNLNNATTAATFSLEGLWVNVQTNGITPEWSMLVSSGTNIIDADLHSNIKERTTYNAINTVHEYMKSKFPSFTWLDFSLPANVDVPGTCNAYYDGSSVNFFAAGGSCNATSLVADVCYHEYGHGINDFFYQSLSTWFFNGAMHEGYADLWAMGITESPIIGIGFFTNPTGSIRRYDINKKVFPQNLVGESHADGEIIAGCFWDTGINLGSVQQMMDLFKETYYAGISGFDGDEGNIFRDILLETLMQDDNDGDITNGTPNYCAIRAAFELHGITLINPLPCAPVANFSFSPSVICAGSSVLFRDESVFGSLWSWDFQGGTPATSMLEDPTIVYNAPGTYDVTLTLTNSNGFDVQTKVGVITVMPGVGQNAVPFVESFETIAFPGNDWSVVNDVGDGWEQTNLAAKTGTSSIYIDNFNNNPPGSTEIFVSPSYDLTGVSAAMLTFELAYATTDVVSSDRLKVLATTNCGQLWNLRYLKTGTNLTTAGVVVSPFIPGAAEWAMQTVNMNSVSYNNKPNVRFKFEYTHDVGNNMFIDDINITGVVGMNELFEQQLNFSVYPNPVSEYASINFTLTGNYKIFIDVLDVLGRSVSEIVESNFEAGEYRFELPAGLNNGLYTVRLFVNGEMISKKVLINR